MEVGGSGAGVLQRRWVGPRHAAAPATRSRWRAPPPPPPPPPTHHHPPHTHHAPTPPPLLVYQFARDVSIQGPNFTTTQENIVLGYLAHAPPDVVVLNAGLHDTSLQDSSPEAYEANMRWYLGLFDALVPRPRLLVLGTTRVDRDKQPAEHREVTSVSTPDKGGGGGRVMMPRGGGGAAMQAEH